MFLIDCTPNRPTWEAAATSERFDCGLKSRGQAVAQTKAGARTVRIRRRKRALPDLALAQLSMDSSSGEISPGERADGLSAGTESVARRTAVSIWAISESLSFGN